MAAEGSSSRLEVAETRRETVASPPGPSRRNLASGSWELTSTDDGLRYGLRGTEQCFVSWPKLSDTVSKHSPWPVPFPLLSSPVQLGKVAAAADRLRMIRYRVAGEALRRQQGKGETLA
ncbi:hypothetical protein FZEAL_4958 [Fusarium zealandicum]|uniref:Uncharacterized protein n=1 Tax=Fusarium zealandicum TaxID=1053134 RepID=A0A8H4UKS4_9HYPO|nr:hypothetical protein FZEAL_4958 [Fusarium zealandicum]